MRARKLFFGLIAICFPGAALATGLISTTGVTQGTAFTEKSATYSVIVGQGVRMSLVQRFSAFGLNLGSADFSAYSHLDLTIKNNAAVPTMVEVVVDSGTSSWAWSDFVIGAGATEELLVPLQPSSVGGWGGGSPNAGGPSQAVFYGTVVKHDVRRVRVWNPLRNGSQDLTVGQMTPVGLSLPTTSLIDAYGQQTASFPGKVTSDQQLLDQATLDSQLSGHLPYSNDAYGGVAGTNFGGANGKWHTAKQNGKWYILTPTGDRFFSTGVDCVANGSLAYTLGRDTLFAPGALPTAGDPLVDFLYGVVNPSTGDTESGYDFYQANLERKYGANWAAMGDSVATARLKTWGFNTVGPSSHFSMYNNAGLQIANMQQTSISGSFRTVPCQGLGSMPDPYDPAWATAVSNTLTPLVAQLRLDPYNVGLFVDNELPWAQNWSAANYRYELAFDVLSAPSDQPAKQRFYKNMSLKYRTVANLNAAWGTTYATWTGLLNNRAFRPSSLTSGLVADMQSFLSGFASQYFSTIRSKLTGLGYQGLYLGCRFDYYSPESIAGAARYCNVVSFNAYDLTPSQWRSDLKSLNAPVLISEFGFAAADLGRAGGFSPCAMTESGRVQAYRQYVADAATWPNLVGLHYYKWEDEPVSGRMWDNANQTLGLVSIADMPYSQMAAAATQVNTGLNTRLTTP